MYCLLAKTVQKKKKKSCVSMWYYLMSFQWNTVLVHKQWEHAPLDGNRERERRLCSQGWDTFCCPGSLDTVRTIGSLAGCNGLQLPCRHFCLQLKAVGKWISVLSGSPQKHGIITNTAYALNCSVCVISNYLGSPAPQGGWNDYF